MLLAAFYFQNFSYVKYNLDSMLRVMSLLLGQLQFLLFSVLYFEVFGNCYNFSCIPVIDRV